MRYLAAAMLVLWSAPASAADIKLNGAEISTTLSDVSLYADGEVEQIFQSGGQTVYIEKSHPSQGLWKVDGDQYCSQWPPSRSWDCYDVVRDGDLIVFISSRGKRYPMRSNQ